MAFWNKIKKKNTTVNDEQRQSSLETRQLNADIKKLKFELEREKLQDMHEIEKLRLEETKLKLQAKISDMTEEEEYNDSEPSIESSLLTALLPALMQNQQAGAGSINSTNHPQPIQESVSGLSFDDEQIKEYFNSMNKKEIKIAKIFTKKQLGDMIKSQLPVDDDTVNRAYSFLH